MLTLGFIGTRAVLNHGKSLPLRLLRGDSCLPACERSTGNVLVRGESFVASSGTRSHQPGVTHGL